MSLVVRLINKEEDAVVEMMHLYGDNLLRTAILLVKDPHLAEEIVQDTFVTAYQKINQLEEETKLKNWLLIITTNKCRERMRKWSWKHIFLHQDSDQEEQIMDGIDEQPEQVAITAWRNKLLYEAIQELPYKYREVVTLYYFQELSMKEIAIFIGEKENTVKTRLSRGRNALKDRLENGGEDIAK